MRPDPFGGSAKLRAPQSWNRYAYVDNDPANNFDPGGLDPGDLGDYEYIDSVEGGGGGGGDGAVVSNGEPANGQNLGQQSVSGSYTSDGTFQINDPSVNPQTVVNVSPGPSDSAPPAATPVERGPTEVPETLTD